MKLKIIILIFLLLTMCRVYSQTPGIKKPKYSCWVFFYSNNVYSKLSAFIYSVSDSGIYFIPGQELKTGLLPHFIPAEAIVEIKIKKIGQIGKGALEGGLIGLLTGAAIGFASGESDGCDDVTNTISFCYPISAGGNAVIWGITLGGVGTGFGALSNHSKINFPINRNQNEFEKQKNRLRKYAVKNN